MTYTKTLLAVSILSAFAGSAVAATMPEVPAMDKFDSIVTAGTGDQSFNKLVWGEGKVAAVLPDSTVTDGGSAPTFLSTIYSGQLAGEGPSNVTNKGTIWVLTGGEYGTYASAMGASVAGTEAVNEGTIYVKGGQVNGKDNWCERTVGMGVDAVVLEDGDVAPRIVNKGTIVVENGTAMKANSNGAGKSSVIVNEGLIEIVGDSYAYGISAGGNDVDDGVSIENNGVINVNAEKGFGLTTSDAVGSTLTNRGKITATTGTAVLMKVDGTLNLEGANSQIDGSVVVLDTLKTAVNATDVKDDFTLAASKLESITLKNSALGFNGDQAGGTTIGTMTTDAGSELAVFGDRQLTVETLEGDQANFKFDSLATERLTIVTNNADNTAVAFTAAAVGTMTPEEAAAAMKDAVALGENAAGEAVDGSLTANGNSFTVATNAAGEILNVTASDITQSSLDMAAMTLVAWRNETTTLTDRMSTLRSNPDQYGAWARWNGGEYKFDDRNLSNKFNTIEVGADTRIGNGPWTVGASLAYTKGEGDFVNGESDTDAYTGALYALWSHESGSFVDMMMKTGRINSDYDFFNEVGGGRDAASFKQTGFIMGVETGHRFALSDMVFVEPQLQLTYSRLAGIHETTAARTIDMEASDSLVGRIGVMAGVKCPNNVGDAYVRVSALRDFRGDVDGTFSGYKASQELDQNWVEFAVGANFKLADNFYTFVDVQKSTGGDIELDWRANVGAKMFF